MAPEILEAVLQSLGIKSIASHDDIPRDCVLVNTELFNELQKAFEETDNGRDTSRDVD